METNTTPYHTQLSHLSDLKNHIGKELGLSDWITIEQDRINTFAEVTEDLQWIHIDPVKCAAHSPYKTTVAHGFLILSLASKFSYDALTIDDLVMGVNYGLDKVRFMNATPSGAKVRGRVSLMEVDPFEGGAKYKVKIIFELEGEEKPACIAEFIAIAYTK